MKSIRAFISIDSDSGIRARLDEHQQKLIQAGADIRWVKPIGAATPFSTAPIFEPKAERFHSRMKGVYKKKNSSFVNCSDGILCNGNNLVIRTL